MTELIVRILFQLSELCSSELLFSVSTMNDKPKPSAGLSKLSELVDLLKYDKFRLNNVVTLVSFSSIAVS